MAQDHQVIGSILDQTGHPAEALASYERARAILERLAELYPTLTLFQNRLAMSHSYVGLARRRAGRPAEAAAEFGRAVAIMERLSNLQPDGYNLYNLACFRSLLSGIAAEQGSGLSGPKWRAWESRRSLHSSARPRRGSPTSGSCAGIRTSMLCGGARTSNAALWTWDFPRRRSRDDARRARILANSEPSELLVTL